MEYKPSEKLLEFVSCYWTVFSLTDVSDIFHRIIPDGCADMVFDINNRFSFITGISDKTEFLKLNGNIKYFGIRFMPAAVPFILREYALGSLNTFIDFDRNFNTLSEMCKRIMSENNMSSVISLAENYLSSFFSNYQISGKFHDILKHSIETFGTVSVKELSVNHCISEKQISRYFKEHMGISTKPYLRIIRFQNAYRYFINRKHTDINQAFENGYYDQSHLIKDVRYYLGNDIF